MRPSPVVRRVRLAVHLLAIGIIGLAPLDPIYTVLCLGLLALSWIRSAAAAKDGQPEAFWLDPLTLSLHSPTAQLKIVDCQRFGFGAARVIALRVHAPRDQRLFLVRDAVGADTFRRIDVAIRFRATPPACDDVANTL